MGCIYPAEALTLAVWGMRRGRCFRAHPKGADMPTMEPCEVTGPKGKPYKLVLLKVIDRDSQGRPSQCVIGYDDEVFTLEQGDEFITGFVPAELVAKKD